MAQKDLYRNGTTYKILEYAFFAGCFTMKQAVLSMGGACAWTTIYNSIGVLYKRQYIERLFANGKRDDFQEDGWRTGKGRNYYTITEEGIRHLGKNSSYHKAVAEYAVRETSLSKAREKEDRMNAYALARGAGLNTYSVQKPSFENLVWLMNGSLKEPEIWPEGYPLVGEADLPAYLEDGIYYTSSEVRKGMEALEIDLDTFLTTRFIGLSVTRDKLSLIYQHDHGKGFTMLPKSAEESLKRTLQDLFPGYAPPSCVMLSDSVAQIASISIGYPHGRNRGEERLDQIKKKDLSGMDPEERELFFQTEEARRRQLKGYAIRTRESAGILTGDTELFHEIYVVPVRNNLMTLFQKAVFLSREKMALEGAAFFERAKGFTAGINERSILNGMVEIDGQYLDAVYLPIADCKILTELRNRYKGKLAVVTQKTLADAISKALGTRAGIFFDLEGNVIPSVRRYKDTGYPVKKDRYDKIAERNRQRAETNRLSGETLSVKISSSIEADMSRKIGRLAKDRGITVSKTVSLALQFALEEHGEELARYLAQNKGS